MGGEHPNPRDCKVKGLEGGNLTQVFEEEQGGRYGWSREGGQSRGPKGLRVQRVNKACQTGLCGPFMYVYH